MAIFNSPVRPSLRSAAAGAAMLMVASCSIADIDQGVFTTLSEERGELVVGADAFVGTAPVRVGFVDFLQREEYVLYRSTKGQAELLYLRARPERTQFVSLVFNKLVAKTLPMWRFNQGQDLKLGESFAVKTPLAQFWAQPYTQSATGRNCAGLYGGWDVDDLDPWFRPRRVIFGYYCVPAGEPMDQTAIRAFVNSIDVRGITLPMQIKTAYELRDGDQPIPSHEAQVRSLVTVQDGIAGGISGIPDFPILAGRSYSPSAGECKKDC